MKLTLDYSKWRCGLNGPNKLGEGETSLLNSQGFMCCLGQFSLQLEPSLREEDIRDKGLPQGCGKEISFLTNMEDMEDEVYDEATEQYVIKKGPTAVDTYLSEEAVKINDDHDSTAEEKIQQLKELFYQEEIEIEVINKS